MRKRKVARKVERKVARMQSRKYERKATRNWKGSMKEIGSNDLARKFSKSSKELL